MRRVPTLCRFLMGCLLACLVWPVLADVDAGVGADHIVARALLEDPDGTLGVEDVAARSFQPAPPLPALGYTRAAHWLRLEVRPRPDGGELVLRIRPSYLDRITLFEPDPAPSGGWRARHSGERVPWMEREHATVVYGFVVRPSAPTVYLLRLENTRSSILHVQALAPLDAQRADVRLAFWQWLFLAGMASILVWAVHDYAQRREAVVAWFALAQACFLAYGMAIVGFLAPLLPASRHLVEITSALICIAELVSLVFHRQLLALFRPPAPWMRAADALVLASAAAMGLCLLGNSHAGLRLNGIVALLAAPVYLLLALQARHDALPGLWVVRGLYAVLTVSLLFTFAPLLGLAQAGQWNLQGGLVQGALGAGLMAAMLALRARRLQRQGEAARIALARSELQLQTQGARLDEQQHFIAMLTHEIKNPLATIRLTLDTLQVDAARAGRVYRAIADMEAIVERCRQTDRMEQGAWPLKPRVCALADLLHDTVAACAEPARVRLHGTQDAPELRTDPLLLGIVLANLLDNALKYGAAATPVELHVGSAGQGRQGGMDGVTVVVLNRAGSAALPTPQDLFRKYYRGPEAQGRSGSGLGLYLVRGLMTRLGGRVDLAPADGWVRFVLWLPLEPRG